MAADKKKDAKQKKPAAAKPAKQPKKEKASKKSSALSGVKLAAEGATRISPKAEPRLQKRYREEIAPALMKKFEFKNAMQVPRIEKVVINCGVKEAVGNPKSIDHAMADIMQVAGQKPVTARARKSIANFKLREGQPIGVTVTLRRARMYEFLDRLINVAIPRVRDFKGISAKAYDGRGNYSLGLREQIIFPEINYDNVDQVRGLSVTIVTSAKTNEHARALLTEVGMPFRK